MGGAGSQFPQEAKQEFGGREGRRVERPEGEPGSRARESPGQGLDCRTGPPVLGQLTAGGLSWEPRSCLRSLTNSTPMR